MVRSLGPRARVALVPMTTHETLLILDFGSQHTQLIARRVREAGVYSEIRRGDLPAAEIERSKPVEYQVHHS